MLRDDNGWPTVVELDIGDSITVTRSVNGSIESRTITLISVTDHFQPDYWILNNPSRQTWESSDVVVDVSGTLANLKSRAYELPKTVNGLRIYVEVTDARVGLNALGGITDLQKKVRLSMVGVGESWGPTELLFPLKNIRWRGSSTYQNTWGGLVPNNLHYYHKGEDMAGIPYVTDVVSIYKGSVTRSPVSMPNDHFMMAITDSETGLEIRYSHMLPSDFNQNLTLGATVNTGDFVGKSGCSFGGVCEPGHSDYYGPHFHWDFRWGGTRFSPYPYAVEAYFREYPDKLIAVGGGYYFTTIGNAVTLDASRSVARPGNSISSYQWNFGNGSQINGAVATATYSSVGVYTEEVTVTADDGTVDKDYAHIRVFDPNIANQNLPFQFLHAYPSRGITTDTNIEFRSLSWSYKLSNYRINFGDGSPTQSFNRSTTHRYASPGLYRVDLTATSEDGDPSTTSLRVLVE